MDVSKGRAQLLRVHLVALPHAHAEVVDHHPHLRRVHRVLHDEREEVQRVDDVEEQLAVLLRREELDVHVLRVVRVHRHVHHRVVRLVVVGLLQVRYPHQLHRVAEVVGVLLLSHLGDDVADLLAHHRRLVRAQLQLHHHLRRQRLGRVRLHVKLELHRPVFKLAALDWYVHFQVDHVALLVVQAPLHADDVFGVELLEVRELKQLRRSGALRGVVLQARSDDRLQLSIFDRFHRLRQLPHLLHRAVDVRLGGALVVRFAQGCQLQQDQPKGIDVHRLVVVPVVHLRRVVPVLVDLAQSPAVVVLCVFPHPEVRPPEISDLDLSGVAVDEHVLTPQVPMDDGRGLRVEVLNPAENLPPPLVYRNVQVDVRVLVPKTAEIPRCEQLRDEVDLPRVGPPPPVALHHVWVV
mmetsp:Transcript_6526/g.13246  ORF Transcript_6526/g.13246 Transcript_6526/m.13246 type:complete len:408 (+) Transcript_6526:249-1472(+)